MKKIFLALFIVSVFPVFANTNSLTTWKYEKIKDPVTREVRENIIGSNNFGIMYAMCLSESPDKTNLIIGFRGYNFEITKNKLENRLALAIDENTPYIMSGDEFLGGTISINQEHIFNVVLELINGNNIFLRLTDDKNINQYISIELNDFMPSFIKTACWKKLLEQSKQ